jgi:hypothetical protein
VDSNNASVTPERIIGALLRNPALAWAVVEGLQYLTIAGPWESFPYPGKKLQRTAIGSTRPVVQISQDAPRIGRDARAEPPPMWEVWHTCSSGMTRLSVSIEDDIRRIPTYATQEEAQQVADAWAREQGWVLV